MQQMVRIPGLSLVAVLLVAWLQLAIPWLTPPTALAVIGPCVPSFSAVPGSPFGVSLDPSSAAAADFSGDGLADLAVVNSTSSTVSILLGNGSGGFTQEGAPIGTGSGPNTVVVADFNGDTRPDLAVSSFVSNNVAVLLRNPAGGFITDPGSPYAVAGGPTALATADFNGDARPDLAVANNGGSLTTLLRHPAGGFTTEGPFAIGANSTHVAVGDFDGDARPDVAVANSGPDTVSILLRNAGGGFSAPGAALAVGTDPFWVVAADFNGDSRADLAVANNGTHNVSILLGNGLGGFAQAIGSPVTAGAGAVALAAVDINLDLKADLVVANLTANTLSLLVGNGSGGFTPAAGSPITAAGGPRAIAVGNFNGDSVADLAIVNIGADNVTVLLGACPRANLGVSISATPDSVTVPGEVSYTIVVENLGPDTASGVTLSAPLPANTTFSSLVTPAGWNCIAPAVGAGGTVTCSVGALPVGSTTFTLKARVTAAGAVTSTVTIDAATADGVGANNTASRAVIAVAAPANCAPRTNVSVAVARAGPNRLQVTINAHTSPATPSNRLVSLQATIPANAQVDVQGGASNLTGEQVLPVGDGTQAVVFFVRRIGAGSVHVPIQAVDSCGPWPAFVGGGNGAF